MRQLVLQVDDTIITKVIEALQFFPKDKLEIIEDEVTEADLLEFKSDLKTALTEVVAIEKGRKTVQTWQDVRHEL